MTPKMILGLLLLLSVLSVRGSETDEKKEKSWFEEVTGMKKKTDAFCLYLNTQASFNAYFTDGRLDETAFKLNQFRIEATGNINHWIYYRWRQALNAGNEAQRLDNLPTSIDYAAVGFRLDPRFSFFIGKQTTAFGGFEFDANPIEIYEYSDMLNYVHCFLTGIDFAWQLTAGQEIRFQIVDSRTGSIEDMFGELPEGLEKSKTPLGYSLNWNGRLWKGLVDTRWSASIFNDIRDKYMYYYAAGTRLNGKKIDLYFDFMYSREGIDRKGMISRILYENGLKERALDTEYLSYVTKMNYRFRPKWNVFLKGMYETASVSRNHATTGRGKYRTAYGYVGGIEFYPLEENLHFFFTYVGRNYEFTERAEAFGVVDYRTQRLSLGFIYKIPVY